jgi:hypothetical protein
MAPTRPNTSAGGPPSASRIGPPASATSRPGRLASSASSISRSAVSSGTCAGGRSSRRRAIAIVPSRDTCGGWALAMPSSRSASETNRSIRSLTAGVAAPPGASHTTSIVSAEKPSKWVDTIVRAVCELEPGEE